MSRAGQRSSLRTHCSTPTAAGAVDTRVDSFSVDTDASVYLGEPVLHEAVVGSLSAALFGPERQDYWRRLLADSGREEERVPVHARLEELRAEIAHIGPRIERQVANLEVEDATPSLRRRVGARTSELEEALEGRRQRTPCTPDRRRRPARRIRQTTSRPGPSAS